MTSKKNKLFLGLFISSIAASLIVGITGTFAWFDARAKVQLEDNVSGQVEGSYFAYGDGTQLKPFGINKPRHLYNLAWLNYQGYFEVDSDDNKALDKVFYFEIDPNLVGNLDGLENGNPTVLPPIGTEAHPFYGHFEGHGKTISNFTFSNDFDDYGKTPITVNEDNFVQPEIVGFIGVIGNYTQTYTYSSGAAECTNVNLTDITVKTVTTRSLVGVVAGYVNGGLSSIKTDECQLAVGNTTTTALTTYTNNLSDYGVVGYCTNNYKNNVTKTSGQVYQVKTSSENFVADTSGRTDEWGGSIGMKAVHDRLNDIRSNYAARTTSFYTNFVSYYDVNGDIKGNSTRSGTTDMRTYTPSYGGSKAYDQTLGSYVFRYDTSTTTNQQFLYMAGGHTATKHYDDYDVNSGKYITDGSHYLIVNTGGTNNVGNASSEAAGHVWSMPSANSSGTISTKFQNTTYYLRNYNGTLQITSTAGNASTWSVLDVDSKRIIYNGNYYLTYSSNSWRLAAVPDSTTDFKLRDNSYSQYINVNTSNYNSENDYYGSSFTSSSASADVWHIDANNRIYRGVNGKAYYMRLYNVISGVNDSYCYMREIYNNKSYLYGVYNNEYYYLKVNESGYWPSYSYSLSYPSNATQSTARSNGSVFVFEFEKDPASSNSPLLQTSQISNHKGPGTYDARQVSEAEYVARYNNDYFYDTSYFPINVNTATDVAKDPSLTLYAPTENNTGYFVGGGSSGNLRFGRHAVSSYLSTSSYKNNKFVSVKTYNDNGDVTINGKGANDPSSNSFEKYDKTIAKLETIMENNANVYGMHFTDAVIATRNKAVAKWASINNTVKTEYELVANSIDFNLKEPGIINFIAGTYGKFDGSSRSSDADSFFSLHQVQRNAQDKIIGVEEIAEIYTDGKKNHSYVYKLTSGKYTTPYAYNPTNKSTKYQLDNDGETTGTLLPAGGEYVTTNSIPASYNPEGENEHAALLFKTEWLKKTGFKNSGNGDSLYYTTNFAYYFEIPVNQGEYALGSVEGGYFGAYLMYLDIGASALSLSRTSVYEHTQTSVTSYTYPKGVSLVDLADPASFDQLNTVLVRIQPSYHGTIKVDRTAAGNEAIISGTNTYAGLAFANEQILSVHKSTSEGGGTLTPVIAAVVTDTYRLRYIDYNDNTGVSRETILTDVFIDNVQQGSREVTQSYVGGDPITGDDIEVYNSVTNGATVDETGASAVVASGARLNTVQINSINIQMASVSDLIVAFRYTTKDNVTYTITYNLTYNDLSGGPTFQDQVGGYEITITLNTGSIQVYVTSLDLDNFDPDGADYEVTINGTPITGTSQTVPGATVTP